MAILQAGDTKTSTAVKKLNTMTDNQLILLNHPHDPPTCYSRAWKTTSTPDLTMATGDIHKLTTRAWLHNTSIEPTFQLNAEFRTKVV